MTNEQFFLGLLVAVVIFLWYRGQPDSKGRMPDKAVTRTKVSSLLEKFSPERSPKLKLGYTEKSIQNQLEKYFQELIQHVTTEYAIEGVNTSRVDFDLGNGAVGVEIKMASSVFKEASQDRMIGQVTKYIRRKYDDENMIVVIYCSEDEYAKKTMKNQIIAGLDGQDVRTIFKKLE